MSFTSRSARLWGKVGMLTRLATEDPRQMVIPALNKREANRLAKVDEEAKAAGQYPLPEAERQRRAKVLLDLEMALLRAKRYGGRVRKLSPNVWSSTNQPPRKTKKAVDDSDQSTTA